VLDAGQLADQLDTLRRAGREEGGDEERLVEFVGGNPLAGQRIRERELGERLPVCGVGKLVTVELSVGRRVEDDRRVRAGSGPGETARDRGRSDRCDPVE